MNTKGWELTQCHTQVIGYGIAGLGLALAADYQNRLDELLNQGLVYLDKREASDWQSLQFDIASNSKASDFLIGIRPNGICADLLDTPAGRRVQDQQDGLIKLTEIAELFSAISTVVAARIQAHPRSKVINGHEASTLRVDSAGFITSYNRADQALVRSRYAVMATGGYEVPLPVIENLAKQSDASFLCSETVLRSQHLAMLREKITSGEKIIVVGSAHSAFSVVDHLLRHYANILNEEQILLLSRSPVRLYHTSVKDCYQHSPLADLSRIDVCSGEVNRYSGLRGDARQVYQNIISGREVRAAIVSMADVIDIPPSSIGCVIQATGYQARHPAVFDAQGNQLNLAAHAGNLKLSESFNVMTSDGVILEQLFALGLGYFNASDKHFSATGEIPVGVNIYHAENASRILAGIHHPQLTGDVIRHYQYAN